MPVQVRIENNTKLPYEYYNGGMLAGTIAAGSSVELPASTLPSIQKAFDISFKAIVDNIDIETAKKVAAQAFEGTLSKPRVWVDIADEVIDGLVDLGDAGLRIENCIIDVPLTIRGDGSLITNCKFSRGITIEGKNVRMIGNLFNVKDGDTAITPKNSPAIVGSNAVYRRTP